MYVAGLLNTDRVFGTFYSVRQYERRFIAPAWAAKEFILPSLPVSGGVAGRVGLLCVQASIRECVDVGRRADVWGRLALVTSSREPAVTPFS